MTNLSQHWFEIQDTLFPMMEKEVGSLTESLLNLIAILELLKVEKYVSREQYGPGRRREDRQSLCRSFVAKSVLKIPTTQMLIERLKSDKCLRQICGWIYWYEVPKEWTFSRAFAEISKTDVLNRIQGSLVEKHASEHLCIGHLSRDSTEIAVRERPKSNKKPKKPKRKRGRPRKGEMVEKEEKRLDRQLNMTLAEMLADLPTECNVGCKLNSKGYPEYWNGYKLHLDSADGGIPVSCLLTSASLHDSQAAIPLGEMSNRRVVSCYDLMDSAYDCPQIRAHSQSLNHVPIIDHNPRRGQEKIPFSPAQKVRFRERSTVERVFSRLKDDFGGRFILVKGPQKVFAHLMFGVLALTADQILKLI